MYEYKEKYLLDFTDVHSYHQFHFLIRDVMDFPHWYGCNFDAFWDSMTDIVGEQFLNIEIVGLENARKRLSDMPDKMLDILRRVKHYDNDRYIDTIRIVIVCKDGTHEELA